MIFLYLLEGFFTLLVLLVVISQIILPLWREEQIFPLWRRWRHRDAIAKAREALAEEDLRQQQAALLREVQIKRRQKRDPRW